MNTASMPAISREDQVQISQPEGVYSSVLAQSMKRQENKDQAASLNEMIRDAKEKADAHREKLEKIKPTPRYGDASLEAYARLKRAQSVAQVNSAAGYARRRIVQLKAAQRSDPDHADQIKATVSQLEKAVSRAGRKKMELNREQLARARQKRMARENRRREEQRIRQELRKNQSMRAIRESGYFKEAEIANRQADQLTATKMELKAQAEQLGVTTYASLDTAMQGYSSAVQTAEVVDAPISTPQVDLQA